MDKREQDSEGEGEKKREDRRKRQTAREKAMDKICIAMGLCNVTHHRIRTATAWSQ